MYGEFFQSGAGDKILRVITVVVSVVDTHVAEPIELTADAHPEIEQIIVAGSLIAAKRCAGSIRQLQHRE